jgi:hypothetical protein
MSGGGRSRAQLRTSVEGSLGATGMTRDGDMSRGDREVHAGFHSPVTAPAIAIELGDCSINRHPRYSCWIPAAWMILPNRVMPSIISAFRWSGEPPITV